MRRELDCEVRCGGRVGQWVGRRVALSFHKFTTAGSRGSSSRTSSQPLRSRSDGQAFKPWAPATTITARDISRARGPRGAHLQRALSDKTIRERRGAIGDTRSHDGR